jgi:hypothetical protein
MSITILSLIGNCSGISSFSKVNLFACNTLSTSKITSVHQLLRCYLGLYRIKYADRGVKRLKVLFSKGYGGFPGPKLRRPYLVTVPAT